MINKIDAIRNQIFVSKPSFKSQKEDKDIEKMNFLQDDNGIQAITNYGKAMIAIPKKFDMKPIALIINSPKVKDDIKGERIFTSEGKLYSIVDENENTKTIYKISNQNDSLIKEITVMDKQAGQIVKKQINLIGEEELEYAVVEEYSSTTGEITKSSTYDDGVLSRISNYAKNPKNELEEKIYYYPEDKIYTVRQDSSHGHIENYATISEDLKFVNVEKSINSKNKNISTRATFFDGALISVEQNKKMTIPSFVGKDFMHDKDLVPAKKYNLEIITPDFEGEKTFYSNGAVESIKTADGTVFFTPEGKVLKLVSPKMEIYLYDTGAQQIKEILDEKNTRITTYDKDGVDIEYSDSKNFKNLTLTSNLKPSAYYEGYFEEDGDKEWTLSYYYDSQGFLESAHNG